MKQPIKRQELKPGESTCIRELATKVVAEQPELNELEFLANAAQLSHQMPESVQKTLHDFKQKEADVAVHFTNLPITDADVGPTPEAHRPEGDHRIGYGEVVHGMIAPLLGEPFGYASQQNANIFNNIIAFKGYGHLAHASVSADNDFGFHTEDAFHPYLPDYLQLACFRNREGAPTGISSLRGVDIPDAIFRVLSEPGRIRNLPNFAHQGVAPARDQQALWGDRQKPYVRINSPKVAVAPGDSEAEAALEFLKQALVRNRDAVVLRQGDLLVIDNAQAVHSRDRFTPIYGAGARWLSRLVMTRDLRKSRALRASPDARVMLQAA